MNSSVRLNIRSCELCSEGIFDDLQWQQLQAKNNMTAREVQVAKLVCSGQDNVSVADSLGISPSTVKTHVRSIYKKMGVTNRVSILLRFLLDLAHSSQQPEMTGNLKLSSG